MRRSVTGETCQDVLARETDVYTGDYSSAVAVDHSDLTARAALTRVTGVIVKWSRTGSESPPCSGWSCWAGCGAGTMAVGIDT